VLNDVIYSPILDLYLGVVFYVFCRIFSLLTKYLSFNGCVLASPAIIYVMT